MFAESHSHKNLYNWGISLIQVFVFGTSSQKIKYLFLGKVRILHEKNVVSNKDSFKSNENKENTENTQLPNMFSVFFVLKNSLYVVEIESKQNKTSINIGIFFPKKS